MAGDVHPGEAVLRQRDRIRVEVDRRRSLRHLIAESGESLSLAAAGIEKRRRLGRGGDRRDLAVEAVDQTSGDRVRGLEFPQIAACHRGSLAGYARAEEGRNIEGLATEAKTSAETDPLAPFSAPVRRWFESSFAAPTPAQAGGWSAIAEGDNALICAPTGSGKTLAAFLWGIDKLSRAPEREAGVRIVYVSPLKALSYDIERNLRAPLAGIGADLSVGLRTGDTPQSERRAMRKSPARHPDHDPRVALSDALLGRPRDPHRGRGRDRRRDSRRRATKRGSHLALSLERLDALGTGPPVQRIGLSATQRPLERVAKFLVGPKRECRIVDAGRQKELDLEIVVPVDDMSDPGAPNFPNADGVPAEGEPNAHVRSIWPAIYPELLRLVQEHTSTIIFVNARRAAERLAKRLNELANEQQDQELPATEHGGNHPPGADAGPPSRRARILVEIAQGSPRVPLSRGADRGRGDAEVRAASMPGGDVDLWSWGSIWGRSIW